MSTHKQLKKEAKDAIDALFSDTSVPQAQTKSDLRDLIEEIQSLLETME